MIATLLLGFAIKQLPKKEVQQEEKIIEKEKVVEIVEKEKTFSIKSELSESKEAIVPPFPPEIIEEENVVVEIEIPKVIENDKLKKEQERKVKEIKRLNKELSGAEYNYNEFVNQFRVLMKDELEIKQRYKRYEEVQRLNIENSMKIIGENKSNIDHDDLLLRKNIAKTDKNIEFWKNRIKIVKEKLSAIQN